MTDPNRQRTKAHRAHGTGSILELGPNRYRLGYDCAAPGKKRKQRFETFRGIEDGCEDAPRQHHRGGSARRHRA